MITRTLALAALVLWAVTVVMSAVFFIWGQTLLVPDGRKAILLVLYGGPSC